VWETEIQPPESLCIRRCFLGWRNLAMGRTLCFNLIFCLDRSYVTDNGIFYPYKAHVAWKRHRLASERFTTPPWFCSTLQNILGKLNQIKT